MYCLELTLSLMGKVLVKAPSTFSKIMILFNRYHLNKKVILDANFHNNLEQ